MDNKTHEDLITELLHIPKYNIYYNTNIKKELDAIKSLGKIEKYQTWKKLIVHVCGARYNIINKDILYANTLIELLDVDKFTIQNAEYERIYNGINHHRYTDNCDITNITIKLCEHSGICNILHSCDGVNIIVVFLFTFSISIIFNIR